MNQSIKISRAVQYVLIAIAIIIFVGIWPTNMIHQTYVSKSNEMIAMESDPVSVERNVTQMFVGEGGELEAVELYVCNDMRGETITFRLYDATYSELFNTFYVVDEKQDFPGFVKIPVGYDLIKDQEYFFTLEGLSADMTVAYEERETSTSIVNGFMSYGGIEIQRYNVIIRYLYANPFTWWQILLSAVLLSAVTAGLCQLVNWVFTHKLQNKSVKVQRVLQITLNPLIIIGTLISLYAIFPARKFSAGPFNYAVNYLGVGLTALTLLFFVNYKRKHNRPIITLDFVKDRFPQWLQVIAIAGTIWYCFEYFNGLYDIHHAYASRRIIIWFMLVIITTYTKKEVLNIWNLIWLIGGSVFGYFYAKPYVGVPEDELLYQLSAYVFLVSGFVIINMVMTIVKVIQKKIKPAKINIPFAVLFVVFWAALIIMRNTREWTWFFAALCGFLIFRFMFWENRDQFIRNLCDGVLLNFLMMLVFSLAHRPYYYYIHHRYNMTYHTVTMTATHLTMSMGAAFVKLFAKWKKAETKEETLPELLLFGCISCYMVFTLSRTGYLAAGAMIFAGLVGIGFVYDQKMKIAALFFKRTALMLLSIVFMFPITFTATRIMPAVSNDPVIYDFEHCIVTMYKGTPTNHEYYMNIERFIAVFQSKVLGIGENVTGKIEIPRMDSLYLAKAENHTGDLADMDSMPAEFFYPASAEDENLYAILGDDMYLASADEQELLEPHDNDDMSNGRFDIFKSYMDNWNLWGHDDMGVILQDGSLATHAHNIFLQVIHDHGLVFGIFFALFMVITGIMSIINVVKNKKDAYQILIPVLLAGFIVAGMVEWIFHPCNPYALVVFMGLSSLFCKKNVTKKEA